MEIIDKGVPFVVDTRQVLPEESVGVMDVQKEQFDACMKTLGINLNAQDPLVNDMLWVTWQAAKAQAVPESNALLSASLDAIQKLGSGDFILVPKEPTGTMVKAGSWNDYAHSLPDNHVVEIYKLMVQAAQEPSHD